MLDPEIEFLRESNAIEGVYDKNSLNQAIVAWEYLLTQKEMTPGVVLRTHKILMLNQPLQPDERGYFRDVPVWVGGREGMNPILIREAIEKWCSLMNDPNNDTTFISKELHVQYEKIHPFVDGNGRTGRMFMNWQRLRSGIPILVIHEGEEQKSYYKWFK